MGNWQLWLARVQRRELDAALQTAFYLLATAGLVFMMMTVAACDCNGNGIDDCDYQAEANYQARLVSMNNQLKQKAEPEVKAQIQGTHDVASVSSVRHYRTLGADVVQGVTAPITYTWYPPTGASNFSFSGRQPDPGGPPFVFRSVPVGDIIPTAFDMPMTGVYGGSELPELLTASSSASPPTTAYFRNTVGQSAAAPETPTVAAQSAPQVDVVPMWQIQRWHTRDGITVTTATCQQAVDLLQSDAAFLALQVPEPPHPVGQSALLPIYGPVTMEFSDYDGAMDVPGKAGFRPGQFTFAANALPAKPGYIWMALGAQPSPALICPADKQSGHWEIHTALTLDLSYAANNCEGCTLNLYVCYEGQTLPGNAAQRFVMGQAFDSALKQLTASTAGAGVQSYRDWGVTCAGPLPLQLINDPNWANWMLVGGSAQWITPTLTITLPHALEGGDFAQAAQIDLTYHAPVGTNWHWSDGTQNITPPVSFPGGYPPANVYLVGTIPAGTPAGLYTVAITATRQSAPGDYRVSTDVVWVGAWSPPPTGGSAPKYRIYLPLALRT